MEIYIRVIYIVLILMLAGDTFGDVVRQWYNKTWSKRLLSIVLPTFLLAIGLYAITELMVFVYELRPVESQVELNQSKMEKINWDFIKI